MEVRGLLVLVTGGTGYVGSHAIATLTNAGHGVRLLARAPDRIPAALEPLGVEGVDTAIGDVTESAAVERALRDATRCCMPPRCFPPTLARATK